MDTKNIAAKYSYLADIAIDTQTPSKISILIRAEQLHLHFYTDVRNPSEPVTLEATLDGLLWEEIIDLHFQLIKWPETQISITSYKDFGFFNLTAQQR